MRRWGCYLLFIFFMLLGCSQVAKAQVTGETFTVKPTASVSWSQMLQQQALRPYSAEGQKLRVIPFMPMPSERKIGTPRKGYTTPLSARSPTETAPAFPSFELSSNFQALPDNDTAIPPDTMGAVGSNYVMTMLNSQVRIQDKSGSTVSTVSLSTFWSSVSGSPFDPILIYDSLSEHWIAAAVSNSNVANAGILLAVTQTSDPTGTWDFYSFQADSSGTDWADFPRVGINSKWIAITANMFNSSGVSPVGSKMWVIDKSTVIADGTATYTEFKTGFDDTGFGNGFTLTPAVTFDSGEGSLYIVDNGLTDNNGNQLIRLSKISGTDSSPVWSVVPDSNGPFPRSGEFYVAHNYNETQIDAAQKGTTDLIDTNDSRILNAVFRNGKLWFIHSGGLPAAGTADRTAIFWYQVEPALLDSTGNPIVQSGVIDPGVGGHLFFPGIAVNKDNDAVIGFSRSNTNIFAEAAFVSRASSNEAGAMSQITVLKTGEASYSKGFGNGDIRWGDYSSTVVDPEDDTTFWTIQEYAAEPVPGGTPNDDRWGTWWGKITPSYAVADAGPDQNVQTGSVVTLDGSGSFDADGNPLTYQWSFTSKPAGSSAALTDPTAVKPAFTADTDGNYVLSLVVNDGTVNSAADSVTITAATVSNSQSSSEGEGGGGGCTINPNAEFDPALLLLMLFAILGLYVRKKRKI